MHCLSVRPFLLLPSRMAHDDQAPATKLDIRLLMAQIGEYYNRTERRVADLEETLEKKILAAEERTKRYFDVVAEAMRHDYLGAHKDRIENHENRIRRLEEHSGLLAR